ncbi:hypothetical protein [Paenibacillus camerounensis]|uniref:hyaluronate lyase N-terminal domain-containing protein n=1 Tax=Paenibacillus camerounensis TaxID=1243663 RepID=UPI000ABCE69C|nr:hypothetical protein [Paenibacillus camerounensis]
MALKTLIQIRRGLESELGVLAAGELGYCTDTGKLYIGTGGVNKLLVASQSTGDMLKSIYDTNNNGKVDYAQTADSVAWSGIAGKPDVFPPTGHTHDDRYPVLTNGAVYGLFPSTSSTMLGNEYNILLNAHKRKEITITQTGIAKIDTNSLFDGRVTPTYSTLGIPAGTPTVITIEGLPEAHTQTGGVIGWTCRYWYPSKYKVEVYDTYNAAGWRVLKDQSMVDAPAKELMIPLYPNFQGQFTKIRITIYDSSVGTADASGNRRFGLSEIFFCHPEAATVFQYLDYMPSGPISWNQLKGV